MPPRPPASPDADLRDTLDLLSQVVANISDRLDTQTATLDRLAKAQDRLSSRFSPTMWPPPPPGPCATISGRA